MPTAKAKTAKPQAARVPQQVTWGELRAGHAVDFGGEPWSVQHNHVGIAAEDLTKPRPPLPPVPKTAKPREPVKQPEGVKPGPVTHVLENLWTGKRVHVTLHPAFKVFKY
jgi:hypothetical protein